MVAGKSPEPLPPGWIEHVKVTNGRTIKYYTNGEDGKKFYSKKAVINLVKVGVVSPGQNQGINNGSSQNQGIGNDDGENQGIGNVDGENQRISNGNGPSQGTIEHESRRSKRSITSPSSKLASTTDQTDQSPEWLPPGWIVESKTRMAGIHKGHSYKCYVSPSGRKFYSKAQVSQHLNTAANSNTPIGHEKNHNVEESSSNLEVSQNHTPKEDQRRTPRKRKSAIDKNTANTVTPTNTVTPIVTPAVAEQINSVNGLPTGWIKELRSRTCPSGIRKDPYYIDPVSGYEFRSKRDVLRYIETGDINKCVIKPKKRDPESASKDIHHSMEEPSSKPEASQNQESMDNTRTSRKRKSSTSKSLADIVSSVAVQNGSAGAGELPPGWISEYKTRIFAGGIRKDPYYTDPVSGYVFRSKKDAFRYIETGDIGKCVIKPTKRELGSTSNDISQNTEESSPKLKVSRGRKPKSNHHINKKQKSGIGKRTAKVAILTSSVEGLPPGWIKEFRPRKSRSAVKGDPFYIDPVSGYEFRSKKDALRYLETGDIDTCAMKPTKRDPESSLVDKSHGVEGPPKQEESQNNASVEDQSHISKKQKAQPTKIAAQTNSVGTANELPPGWIKETRPRAFGGGIRHDPYYIDPVSGYVFRSKKDVFRYIETGDIAKCVMKPYKRVPGSTLNGISTPPHLDSKKEASDSTKRQLFASEEMKDKEGVDPATDVATTQAEDSTKRRRSITHDFINPNSGAEITAVKRQRGRPKKGSGTKPTPETTLNGDTSVISTPQSMTKSRKPRKAKDPSLPGRSSKRLGQHTPEVVANLGVQAEKGGPNLGFEEQALQGGAIPSSGGIDINTSWGPNDPVQKVVADLGLGEDILQASVMNASGIDVNTSLGPIPSNPAQKVPQHFDANKPTTEIYHDCLGDEPLFPAENRGGIQGKQIVGGLHDDDVDMNLPLPNSQPQYRTGDCWSDPCLDFALKTLTGGGMSTENSRDHTRGGGEQQFDQTYTQADRCFKLPVYDPSRGLNNNPSAHSGSFDKQGSVPQDSPLLPPGFGLPNYTGMASHPSGLDARKDYPPSL